MVSVLIASKDRPEALVCCLKSVFAQTYENREILVLDDNSSESLWNKLERPADSSLQYLRTDTTLGVAGSRNRLIQQAKGNILLILDDDAILKGIDSLGRIVELFTLYPDVGLFAFKIINIVNEKQIGAKVPFHRSLLRRHREILDEPQYVSYFVGAGHAARKEIFKKCGLYPSDFFYSHEELDLSYRIIEQGYKIFYAPQVLIEHYPGQCDLGGRIVKSRYLYFAMRNRIWVNYKYLPRFAFVLSTMIWCIVRMSSSFVHGGFAQVMMGIRDGFGGLKRLKRTTIGTSTRNYLRRYHGRLFF